MAAIIPFFEEVLTLKERREEGPTGAPEALGVARGAPAPSTLHVSLEKLVQGRQIIEKWLVVNGAQILAAPKQVHPPKTKRPKMPDLSFGKFDSDGRPLKPNRAPQPWFLWVGRMEAGGWVPLPLPSNLVFWAPMAQSMHSFALWSESNGKMACPVWDLPAGSNLLGGSCPGATPGQSVVPARDRANYARQSSNGLVQLRFPAPRNREGLQPLPIELQETICERCLEGSTMVTVRGRGSVPIRELVGQRFEVWSGKAWRETTCKLTQRDARIISVHLDVDLFGGVIHCTPDHEFILPGGRRKQAGQLERGDRLLHEPPPGYKGLHLDPHVSVINDEGRRADVYDLINVGDEHQFSANGISVSNCYATGNNYQMASNLTAMTLRYWWVRQCLRTGNSELLVDTIVRSLAVMRFDARDMKRWGIKPVRIHSSGDFFSLEYLRAWVEVANRVAQLDPTVSFWAPTRIWANGQGDAAAGVLRELRQPNLVIRASAYSVGDPSPGPLGGATVGRDHGAAQGSTSCYEPHKKLNPGEMARAKGSVRRPGSSHDARYDFDCSVYQSDEPSCLAASKNPTDTGKGCRACWKRPDLSINYTTH